MMDVVHLHLSIVVPVYNEEETLHELHLRIIQANALRASYGSCSTYSIVSPLHPGHPIVGIPPVYSPLNLAAPMATSIIASLTSISSPQTGQR